MPDSATVTPETAAGAWNDEYGRQGIPSSHRSEPSGVVLWMLDNLHHVVGRRLTSAIDLGCGTGRNSIALSDRGFSATGIDFAERALATARHRPGADRVSFIQGDLASPIPVADGSEDLVLDVFVYFHQLSDEVRRSYRREIRRILPDDGVLLVSLATQRDEYYASCPKLEAARLGSSVDLRWDPEAKVGNILLTEEQFTSEFADLFELQMTWLKSKLGHMHGREYERFTVAGLWTPRKTAS